MADSKLNPEVLVDSTWRELRTEVRQWDDDDGVSGFDCLTRYWCPEAVFEIYWVAECGARSSLSSGQEYEDFCVYLTEDLQLAGFKQRLEYQPSIEWKRTLAIKLGWQQRAEKILRERSGTQADLFKE